MMQETVHQNHIESIFWRSSIVPHVSDHEIPAMAALCVSHIKFVAVYAKISRVGKVSRVCAGSARHVEHAPDITEIVARHNRSKLLFSEWRLPHTIQKSMLEHAGGKIHGLGLLRLAQFCTAG